MYLNTNHPVGGGGVLHGLFHVCLSYIPDLKAGLWRMGIAECLVDFKRFTARILCDTDDRPVRFTRQELGFHLPQERNLRLRDVLERLQVSGRVSIRFISQPPRNLVQHPGQETMHGFHLSTTNSRFPKSYPKAGAVSYA